MEVVQIWTVTARRKFLLIPEMLKEAGAVVEARSVYHRKCK